MNKILIKTFMFLILNYFHPHFCSFLQHNLLHIDLEFLNELILLP